MGDLDVVEIVNDVLLGNGSGRYIVVVAKQVAQLREIIADGTGRILFSGKEVCELYKQSLRLGIEGYFS